MKSRLVPRAILIFACALPLSAWADEANDAAIRGAIAKALDTTIRTDLAKASPDASRATNAPAAPKAEHVQPQREPPADVAVLEVRPDSGYCLSNPSQDDGC